MKLLLFLLIPFWSLIVVAGEASYFTNLGFSSDGRHYAYMQDGVSKKINAYYAQIDVIDVTSNKLIVRKLESAKQGNGKILSPEVTLRRLLQKIDLRQYGIDKENMGDLLISRPHTDFSQYTQTVFSRTYWAQGGRAAKLRTYTLELQEQDAPVEAHNNWCWAPSKIVELSMKWDEKYLGDQQGFKLLQKDLRQPASRSCSYGYRIQYVLAFKNKLALALRYLEPGLEGPNNRFVVVTGLF